jgi:hypothetical protein
VRRSGRYPLCGRGDINTYSIFAETNRLILGPSGRVGCIVPTGIATDDTTKLFFADLVRSQTLVSVHGFENEEFIFPSVHHATKFCLLTTSGVNAPVAVADFVFFARQVTDLQDQHRHFTLTQDDIALLNPNTHTCPIFRTRRDAEITKAIYRREILRQKWCLGQSHRAVAESLGIGSGTVGTTVLRARAAGLDWGQVESLTDEVLEARVYGPPTPPTHHRVVPDCAYLHAERRKPGVTLELLHLEYLEQHPDGYRYTQFCEFYRRWCKRRGLSMRQVHRGGEKCFVDYAGTQPTIIDAATGEVIPVQLFVAVLGASNYTYAEATRTQQVPDWIASHQRAFQ